MRIQNHPSWVIKRYYYRTQTRKAIILVYYTDTSDIRCRLREILHRLYGSMCDGGERWNWWIFAFFYRESEKNVFVSVKMTISSDIRNIRKPNIPCHATFSLTLRSPKNRAPHRRGSLKNNPSQEKDRSMERNCHKTPRSKKRLFSSKKGLLRSRCMKKRLQWPGDFL